MEITIIKTSANNWTNYLTKQCKSQKPILIINDSLLRNEDMLNTVHNLLKYFILSSKQLILRKILLIILPVIGVILTIILGYGVFTVINISANLFTILQTIFAFLMCLTLSSLAIYKLITAKKPKINNLENEIKIEWNKY